MRISLNWVAELLGGIDAMALRGRADEVASRLTFAGLEVERIERIGAGLEAIVVARVAEVKAHPQADRLSVVQIEAGHERLQVVSGARNFQVGDLVPLARSGTRLPTGKLIEAAELRGIASQGMLCSELELGVSEDHGGIWVLPTGIAPGRPLVEVLPLVDVVFDINVTPNRSDCLSQLGVARELAALLELPMSPSLGVEPAVSTDLGGVTAPSPPRIEQPERCGRYEGQLLVGIGALALASPFLWRYRLHACGVRPVSLAVDATNYVLLELGQPLHAFDRQKLEVGVTVRIARRGERLVTLDGLDRELSPDDLCICDGANGERPIALAGVMGGASTAVGESTEALYLEAAQFSSRGVRQSARRHGIESEAAYRFARGVDPNLPSRARRRAVELLTATGARVGPWAAADGVRAGSTKVTLHFRRVEQLLGEAISPEDSRSSLRRLHIEPDGASDEVQGTFVIPSYRLDVEEETDLIAEVGRLRGFDRLPGRPPDHAPELVAEGYRPRALASVRETLRSLGFSETLHHSFLHDPATEAFGAGKAVRVVNPLAIEASEMRRSLLPSLLQTARRNLAHLTQDAGVAPPLRLFEIARTYHWPAADERGEGPALEPLSLAWLVMGSRQPLGWSSPRDGADFYDLKAVLERVLATLSVRGEVRPAGHAGLHPRSASGLFLGESNVGLLGELHPTIAEACALPRGVLVAEIGLDPLLLASAPFLARPVPRFPAVLRDLALVVEDSVPGAALDAVLRQAGGELLEALTCFDVYRGPPLDKAHKSLAYSLRFRASDRTLTDAEAVDRQRAMVEAAAAAFGASLR